LPDAVVASAGCLEHPGRLLEGLRPQDVAVGVHVPEPAENAVEGVAAEAAVADLDRHF
jgi:hypothetical protein